MKKYEFKISTGITSIMMIFVVLCLTAFGVLSYSSANADIKLSEKNADSIEEYYEAEGRINEKICEVDAIVNELAGENLSDEEYYAQLQGRIDELLGEAAYNIESNIVTINESISEKRILCAVLKISDDTGSFSCSTESYFVQTIN